MTLLLKKSYSEDFNNYKPITLLAQIGKIYKANILNN